MEREIYSRRKNWSPLILKSQIIINSSWPNYRRFFEQGEPEKLGPSIGRGWLLSDILTKDGAGKYV